MVNIDLVSSYKPCKKKQYEIWACKPPRGTVVINKVEQKDVLDYLGRYIKKLHSDCFLTPKELEHVRNNRPELYNEIVRNCYITNDKANIVLSGTIHEMWVTSFEYLCKNYDMSQSNNWVPVETGIRTRIKNTDGERVFDWCKVRTKVTTGSDMAMFVPRSQQGYVMTSSGQSIGYNLSGVAHGKGDFIVCSSGGGMPNLNDRRVVNGLVFAHTYDNRGWSKYLENGGAEGVKPKSIFKVSEGETLDGSLNELLSRVKSIYDYDAGRIVEAIKSFYSMEGYKAYSLSRTDSLKESIRLVDTLRYLKKNLPLEYKQSEVHCTKDSMMFCIITSIFTGVNGDVQIKLSFDQGCISVKANNIPSFTTYAKSLNKATVKDIYNKLKTGGHNLKLSGVNSLVDEVYNSSDNASSLSVKSYIKMFYSENPFRSDQDRLENLRCLTHILRTLRVLKKKIGISLKDLHFRYGDSGRDYYCDILSVFTTIKGSVINITVSVDECKLEITAGDSFSYTGKAQELNKDTAVRICNSLRLL